MNLILPLWVLHGVQRGATPNCAKFLCNDCVPAADTASSPPIPMPVMWLFADIALGIARLVGRSRPHLPGPSPFS